MSNWKVKTDNSENTKDTNIGLIWTIRAYWWNTLIALTAVLRKTILLSDHVQIVVMCNTHVMLCLALPAEWKLQNARRLWLKQPVNKMTATPCHAMLRHATPRHARPRHSGRGHADYARLSQNCKLCSPSGADCFRVN
jgi:hypothetical protein